MSARPFLSLLTTLTSDVGVLGSLLSLNEQYDDSWQWCIVVQPGAAPGTYQRVAGIVRDEGRATVTAVDRQTPGELALAAAAAASGEYLGWLDQGARLDPSAISSLRTALADADWAYTDECVEGVNGQASDLWLKPDFSPELLRSQPYALFLAALPASVVDRVGGFSGRSDVPWYDLVLRVSEVAGSPAHVAGPHYIRPAHALGLSGAAMPAPPFLDAQDDADARCAAVADHCGRLGIAVDAVLPVEIAGRRIGQRLRRRMTRTPRVSVIIPTRGTSTLTHGFPRRHVVELVAGLVGEGSYPDLEIVVVHDDGTPAVVLDRIEEITAGNWVSLPFHGPFHFSRKCNAGAMVATGEYLCFLNDDMDVADPGWLVELVALLVDDATVGAVGPKLLFADGTLQHGGHIYNRTPGHLLFGEDADSLDFGGWAQLTGERSGVTGAALLTRSSLFAEVGGFSELFPLNFNDVDLCLKIRAAGLRILYDPFSWLYHYESQTRVAQVSDVENRRIERRWFYELHTDPYWNPLLRKEISAPVADQDLPVDMTGAAGGTR